MLMFCLCFSAVQFVTRFGFLFCRYNLCGKFTLAIFGVWAFEPPEPYTVTENWFTVTLTVFAASFYAYLAGIIVELV